MLKGFEMYVSHTHSLTHSLHHSLHHSLTHSITNSFIHSLTHSFIHFIHSLTHSLTHSLHHSLHHSLAHPLSSLTNPITLSCTDWLPGRSASPNIYWLYMTELALYCHSIYATLYLEAAQKDFVVLMIHHFVTIALIGYSHAIG